MWLVQLCLALLLGMLGPLASAPRMRGQRGGWYPWSGVLLAAWMAGVSGILAQRFPDWAVLYLFEALGHSRNVVGLPSRRSLGRWSPPSSERRWWSHCLSQGRDRASSREGRRGERRGFGADRAGAGDRLVVVATTFEFQNGLARPFSRVIGFQGAVRAGGHRREQSPASRDVATAGGGFPPREASRHAALTSRRGR